MNTRIDEYVGRYTIRINMNIIRRKCIYLH